MGGGDIPLDQPFDPGTLVAARAAVQAHAHRAGMSEERVMEVVLAVHELMANAICHGAGKGRLRMWQAARVLRCQVDDEGGLAPAVQAGSADPWPVRDGHGLWVVRQVADQMEVLSGPGGTRASIAFTLPTRPVITRPSGSTPTGTPQ